MTNDLANLSPHTAAGIDVSPRLAGRIAGWGILAMALVAPFAEVGRTSCRDHKTLAGMGNTPSRVRSVDPVSVRGLSDRDSQKVQLPRPGASPVLPYPSMISLSSQTLNDLPDRIRRGSIRSRWRRLDAGRQALLAAAHLRNPDT